MYLKVFTHIFIELANGIAQNVLKIHYEQVCNLPEDGQGDQMAESLKYAILNARLITHEEYLHNYVTVTIVFPKDLGWIAETVFRQWLS